MRKQELLQLVLESLKKGPKVQPAAITHQRARAVVQRRLDAYGTAGHISEPQATATTLATHIEPQKRHDARYAMKL